VEYDYRQFNKSIQIDDSMDKGRILNHVEENREEIIGFMKKLLQTESLTGDESEIAYLMKREMEKDGLEVDLIEPEKNRISTVGIYRGSIGEPRMMMYSHYDTVPPGDLSAWDLPPLLR
jgi:acetylornithine deacetylase/succinyl-diaminopimelate desuccinylase-like protein